MGFHTIVIGAGASGCVIAERLSRAGQEVLLVEAGPDYPDPSTLPADLANGRRNSMRDHDWGLRRRLSRGPAWIPVPRGRVVGGSSAVNTCIGVRGEPADYDEWADLGLDAWSWDDVAPAFDAIAHDVVDGPEPRVPPSLPLRQHPREELKPWTAAFIDAARSLGFPETHNHNVVGSTGVGVHAMNKLAGRRISAAETWLTPAVRARTNLTIRAQTRVDRLVIHQGRVQGAILSSPLETQEVTARRIVVCAGAIHTPGILLRSGIGPRDELTRLGVPLVADLPAVGARLLDHPGFAIVFHVRPGVSGNDHPVIQAAIRTTSEHDGFPNDLQLQAGNTFALPLPRPFGSPLASLMGHIGKPRGDNGLHWPSADPAAKPQVIGRYLHDAHDVALAAEGMAHLMRLAHTPQMRPLWRRTVWPPRRLLRGDLGVAASRSCDSGYHPCGTVPMGREGDPHAATDGRGRVRGVEGLWVGDASLMPTVPTGNTHLPTLMIGHRIGTWLAESHT